MNRKALPLDGRAIAYGISQPFLGGFFLYRHSREGGNPLIRPRGGLKWIPAFAGMTIKNSNAIALPSMGGGLSGGDTSVRDTHA